MYIVVLHITCQDYLSLHLAVVSRFLSPDFGPCSSNLLEETHSLTVATVSASAQGPAQGQLGSATVSHGLYVLETLHQAVDDGPPVSTLRTFEFGIQISRSSQILRKRITCLF